MRIRLVVLLTVLTLLGGVLAHLSPGAAATPRTVILTGVVGPGFTISLKNARGARVTSLKPGRYTFAISDRSGMHNFHLRGPGVDKRTSVSSKVSARWTVTLKNGTYTYQCDPHLLSMRGTVRVS